MAVSPTANPNPGGRVLVHDQDVHPECHAVRPRQAGDVLRTPHTHPGVASASHSFLEEVLISEGLGQLEGMSANLKFVDVVEVVVRLQY